VTWSRIMAPLAGADGDEEILAAAQVVAAPFGAEVAGVHIPLDTAALSPWFGEGIGADVAAMAAVRDADRVGLARARQAVARLTGDNQTFMALEPPHLHSLSLEARLSDLIVFDGPTACGKGRLADTFRSLMFSEQRPIVVTKNLTAVATIVVAWDGGKEASRAARTAIPLLVKAQRVVILWAGEASSRVIDPSRLQTFLADHGVESEIERLPGHDAAPVLLDAARAARADLMVAGAFGHTRLREIVFGGATRALLHADGPSLYLSH